MTGSWCTTEHQGKITFNHIVIIFFSVGVSFFSAFAVSQTHPAAAEEWGEKQLCFYLKLENPNYYNFSNEVEIFAVNHIFVTASITTCDCTADIDWPVRVRPTLHFTLIAFAENWLTMYF